MWSKCDIGETIKTNACLIYFLSFICSVHKRDPQTRSNRHYYFVFMFSICLFLGGGIKNFSSGRYVLLVVRQIHCCGLTKVVLTFLDPSAIMTQDWKALSLLCWLTTVWLHAKILQWQKSFRSTRESCIYFFSPQPLNPSIALCAQTVAQVILFSCLLDMCLINVFLLA